ncbi:MAG: sacsin N-terminal ATP-binding-like domain-containing protein, partial [Actinomycetales bacterium]
MSTADPFGTAGLRAAVLDAWRASPARFREDANSEEDLVVGGYRDRLLVELAQNAADATRLSGVPGRLRVELTISPSPQLVVSNTGVPLDRAGVIGLSTLRASGKRHGDTIGRFGVGFAAVLAVSDSPEVRSRHGGVRFSLAESAELARSLPELAPELERRSFRPPVLRLPFPSDAAPEAGFDTTVVLPLRDAHAVDEVIAAIHQVDEALLLVLEPLAELALVTPSDDGFDERRLSITRHDDSAVIVTATQTTTGESTQASTSWLLERRSGSLPPELAATLPTEARAQDRWDVLWALPDRTAGDGGRRSFAVHAPTETDEPLTLPALLVASLPLQPDRRHVLPGPVTDRVIEEAASAYPPLAVRVGDPMLVPMGFTAGALDSRLHELVRDLLRGARILGGRRPPEAVWVPALGEGVLEQLRPQLPELVGPPWSRAPRALRALEVPERGIADVVDALASVRADPEWWGHLYSLLDADGVSRDDLGALPVPLLDGRLVRGARGVLLPSQSLPSGADPELLAELSLRVAHPAAVAPAGAGRLLARLGAVETDASALLHDPAVAAALSRADDEGDEAELLRLARFVLALLAASPALTEQPGLALAELPWLADLELPAADGELRFADELALPDSPLLRLAPDDLAAVDLNTLDLDTLDLNTLDLDTIRRDASREALVAAGVRDTFPVVLVRELPVEADESELAASVAALDDVAGWLDFLAAAYPGATVVQARALADLDLVADEDWPLAFELLGTRRETLDAVLAPAELQLPDGAHATAASYATWWLSQHALLAGRAPSRWSTGEDALLAELLPTVPVTLDPALQRALGVRTTLSALLSEPGGPEAVL